MPSNGRLKTLRTSAETTTAKTEVSDWYEVDDMNEMYVALNVTAFAARSDETLVVTIERWSPNTNGYTTIGTFTTISATGASSEELYIDTLANKVRVRCVTAGTWSSKSITFEVVAYFKRVNW